MAAGEVVLNVLFYVFSALGIAGAAAVAAGRSIVRSAFALLAVLLSVAALYAIAGADFLAAAQVLVYAGGIVVLILFAVMLTHRISDVRRSSESAPGSASLFGALGLLVAVVAVVLSCGTWVGGAARKSFRVGNAEFSLAQYRSDGRTGLAWGGEVPEGRLIVELETGGGGPLWREVEIEARGEGGRAFGGSAPLAEGRARVVLRGLPEGKFAYRVRLRGAEGTWTDWIVPDPGEGRDSPWAFSVSRGITKPLARALMGPYLFAFEAVSLLLLAALVGAAHLARKEARE